jgi:hypothetical protein
MTDGAGNGNFHRMKAIMNLHGPMAADDRMDPPERKHLFPRPGAVRTPA